MRFIFSLLGGLLITVAVFLFMQSLIQSRQQQDALLPVYSTVDILQEEPEEEEPEPEEVEPEEPLEEPVMDSLEIAPPTPEPAAELEISALDLAMSDIKIQASGDRWNGQIGGGVGAVSLAGGGGEDAQGFIEVIPFDTRRPNVPDVAYQNKISGWVLVAFRVTGDGGTRDVRVL